MISISISVKLLFIILFLNGCFGAKILNTLQRIREHGYNGETHKVQTSDGYVLTMYRIPPQLKGNSTVHGTPVFLMHGLLSSSDCWILNGPKNALAYLLSDAGYDVWMGNHRGNTYSKKHVKYSPFLKKFWNFSWNEIALYDISAMIDYVLYKTNFASLQYVGHSQGTTVFFVLMSLYPKYQTKIKSAHMLAPVGYMSHMESPIASVLAPLLGRPAALVELFGSAEFLPSNSFLNLLGAEMCKETSPVNVICTNILFLICGYDSENMNNTLVPDIVATHPAGSSVNQVIHYLQEYKSAQFRKFDYGFLRNKLEYDEYKPPPYSMKNIKAAIFLYYGDNDYLAAVTDVNQLARELSNVQLKYMVPHQNWNHLDFLWGLKAKELLFDKLIDSMDKFNKSF